MSAIPSSLTDNAPSVKLLIGGEFVESKTTEWRDIVNPATQQKLARVPFATVDEVDAAIRSAHEAFKTWKNTPLAARDAHPICLSNTDPQFALANCDATEWLMEINVNSAKLPKYSYFEFFTANRMTTLK